MQGLIKDRIEEVVEASKTMSDEGVLECPDEIHDYALECLPHLERYKDVVYVYPEMEGGVCIEWSLPKMPSLSIIKYRGKIFGDYREVETLYSDFGMELDMEDPDSWERIHERIEKIQNEKEGSNVEDI